MPALEDIDDAPHPAFDDEFTPPPPNSGDPIEALGDVFGFSGFRPLQEEAVRATLDGRDVLVVMPTGAGKSLCFQLPALMAREGVTVVVSPLIALMHDQVDALARRSPGIGNSCACLTSLQSFDDQRAILGRLRGGMLRLLYVAPERFRSQAFLDALRSTHVTRFVVDEAHCISEWGHDFRPDYLSLLPVLESLGRPPVLAATATATVGVQQSIVGNLGLRDPVVLVGGFNRPNLHWSVHRSVSEKARIEKLESALPKLAAGGGSGLIYAPTRKACEELAATANHALSPTGRRAGVYHAGMAADDRTAARAAWLAGEITPTGCHQRIRHGNRQARCVRYVIHAGYPDSLESYYQEAGRAGRDGLRSRCVILTTPGDWRTREWFLNNENLEPADVRKLYGLLRKSAEGEDVRIAKNDVMRAMDASLIKLRLALAELDRAQLICRLAETSDDIALTLGPNPWSDTILGRIGQDLRRQHKERERRLGEMSDYCRSTSCRRRAILAYFGDHDAVTQTKSCCDNCDRPPSQAAVAPFRGPAVPMPASIKPGDFHDILHGLDALRPSLGRTRLGKLLRGANTTSESAALLASPVNGCMSGASRDKVNAFLDSLVKAGFLRIGDETEYHVCTVTETGRAAWRARTPMTAITSRPAHGRRQDEPRRSKVERDRRATISSRPFAFGEPVWRRPAPCRRMSSSVIASFARSADMGCPATPAELLVVSGVGDRKLEQYGEAVLAIVAEHGDPPSPPRPSATPP